MVRPHKQLTIGCSGAYLIYYCRNDEMIQMNTGNLHDLHNDLSHFPGVASYKVPLTNSVSLGMCKTLL